jgi:phosphoenolpyruvate synthase/pyruvate phosphate dikinase
MKYVVTINNVNLSEHESLGFRAVDLAALREKRLNVPLTFMVRKEAFDQFMAEHDLKPKIDSLLKEKKPAEAYHDILELFSNANLPREISDELYDAYESLTIDPGASASSIVSEWDYPFVTLIRSPNYLLNTEDEEGIIQNIRGKEALAEALKYVWASIYSPKSVAFRSKVGITKPLGMGLIVQKMKKIKQSAIAYSRSDLDERTIIVKSFFGFPDFGFESEILGKDYYEVDLNSLGITKAEINTQEFSIDRDFESEELIKHELRDESSSQKINDRMISEIARITKRAKSFVERDLKLYIGIKDEFIYVFLANRIVAGPKKLFEADEEMELKAEGKGGKAFTQKKEILIGQQDGIEAAREVFSMPKILSPEEAKQELLKEGVIKELSEENEAKEKAAGSIPGELGIEVYEEKTKQEEQVEKEINLLEEVLQIKDIIEKMEEHALNNSKEAYEREARQLKSLMSRIREEE